MENGYSLTPEELFFKGRPGDPRLGDWVMRINSLKELKTKTKEAIALMGCADDRGIVLNHGRAGADEGPNSIRKYLYRMTPPMDFNWEKYIQLFDAGNILPLDDLQDTHNAAQSLAREITLSQATLITLGGGHDFAAPTFKGFHEGLKERLKKAPKIGLINIDPHLDVRPLENDKPNSGTPFRQLLETVLTGKAFVEFGIRTSRNARENFIYCKEKKVRVITLDSIRNNKSGVASCFKKELSRLSSAHATLGLTIDIDSCSESEGSSAAPVIGFSASELCQIAAIAGTEKKVRFFEIAEVAPNLDATERSSRIAAEIIYSFLSNRANKHAIK